MPQNGPMVPFDNVQFVGMRMSALIPPDPVVEAHAVHYGGLKHPALRVTRLHWGVG